MIEITDELIKKLDKIYATGERNRNTIMNSLIEKDKELKKVFGLYRMQKNEFEIMIETKLPIKSVRESIENIDELSRIIDQGIRKITLKKSNQKKAEKENFLKRITPKEKLKEVKKGKANRIKDDDDLEL